MAELCAAGTGLQLTETLRTSQADAAEDTTEQHKPELPQGKPSVDNPWNTPGASIPLTPPSSVDLLHKQVVTIEADMHMMSNWCAMAAHEAKDTGIPAGAAWCYAPSSSCAG